LPFTLLLIAFELMVALLVLGKGTAVRLGLLAAIVFQIAVIPGVAAYGLANLTVVAFQALLLRTDFNRTALQLISGRVARTALLAFDGFLGLTAALGGLGILLDWWGLTEDMLAGSPFDSYLVPGLALLLVVGGSGVAATLAVLRYHPLAAPASAIAGLAIIGFEVVQAAVIGLHPLQVFYGMVGLLIITLAARLWSVGDAP
jgi:hypothetical protein